MPSTTSTTIYTVPLPEVTTPQERESLATELAEQGVLNGDSIVNALSTDSADLSLTGRYAYGQYYSELLATELEELANSQLSGVPLFDGAAARAGFYEIASADVEPVHAGGRDIWEWDLSLTKKGTRKTHFRAVTLAPAEPTTPFGTTASTTVALPASASLVRALDSRSAPTERVSLSPTETVTGAHGDIDIYDVDAVAIDDPVIIYDAARDAHPPVDVHVYDTRGRDEKFITADNGRVRAWQSVFDTGHEFAPSAAAVIENGLLRVRLNEPDAGDQSATLTAERWDTSTDSWSSVALPSYDAGDIATDWVPVDADVTHIGQASVEALVEFEAAAGDAAGEVFRLDLRLFRGRDSALVTIPASESGPVPAALYDLLEPIASDRVIDPGVEQTLVERQEVR